LAYQTGYNSTMRFLRSRGVPGDRAREVSQAAWAKGWERLEQLNNESMVLTWVNTIAINVHRRVSQNELPYRVLPEVATAPSVNLAAIDVTRILRCCASADRMLFEQQMTGMTPGEIARAWGLSEGALRIRMLRARRAARLRLEKKQGLRASAAGVPALGGS
jgi:DNA-directed RNA polymerase specialized sigma24 family protein